MILICPECLKPLESLTEIDKGICFVCEMEKGIADNGDKREAIREQVS